MNQKEKYKSKWKPLYDEFVELRREWETVAPANGGGGSKFALCLLMQGWSGGAPPAEKAEFYKKCVSKSEMICWYDEAIKKWGLSLDRLYKASKRLDPPDGIFEDAYHCALKMVLDESHFWRNSISYLAKTGLFPEMPASLECDMTLSDILQIRENVQHDERNLPRVDGFKATLCSQDRIEKGIAKWMANGRELKFFRGQCKDFNKWPLKTSLDRREGAERIQMAQRVSSVAASLSEREGISFNHACALIQHYSFEVQLSTHLMDVTLEPLIALYFATSKPEANEIGVVGQWSLEELKNLGFGKDSILGNLSFFTPGDEPRICRQRGLFLASPCPLAINQTFQFTIAFRQHPGLHFEDPARDITKAYLEECQHDWLLKIREAMKKIKLFDTINLAAIEGLGPVTEERLLEYLKYQLVKVWNPISEPCMNLLVKFHLLNTYSDSGVKECRSLRLLNDVAYTILSRAEFDPLIIPRRYHEHAQGNLLATNIWFFWEKLTEKK